MNKFPIALLTGLAFLVGSLSSCENRNAEQKKVPEPQIFTPVPETEISAPPDSGTIPVMPADPSPQPAARRQPLPTIAELKKITPGQEAKRSLNNDAMKAFTMKPEAFARYMQSRIPYYRGKGELQTANDVVKIVITDREMQLETLKGKQVFSMQ